MRPKIRTYRELIQIPTFEERLQYLRLDQKIGVATFGFERYLNQNFYHSPEWLKVRSYVIGRDLGCDLAMPDYVLEDFIVIHHMNAMTVQDLRDGNPDVINPEFLVCASDWTHKAIHYGTKQPLYPSYNERRPNDTCPWR